jgi:hypothetical protein
MSLSNAKIVSAWKKGEKAINGRKSLSTDGVRLYSYRLLIGVNVGGTCFMGDYTSPGGSFRSQTTSQHVGRAKRASEHTFHPAIFETMVDDLLRAASSSTNG